MNILVLKYEGKNYQVGNVENVGELEVAMGKAHLGELLKNGHLKWNVSFFHDGKFESVEQLGKDNLQSIKSLNIILQLAGG